MEVREIMEVIPHRYPFLLVDRVIELEPGQRAVGLKNVSAAEPYFQGHFPGNPVMPGVLIVEALAQVAGVCLLALPEYRGKMGFFAGIDGARFRKPVVPGDQLRLEAEILRVKGKLSKASGKALVGEQVVAEAHMLFAIE